jgi:hypothetical protein
VLRFLLIRFVNEPFVDGRKESFYLNITRFEVGKPAGQSGSQRSSAAGVLISPLQIIELIGVESQFFTEGRSRWD